MIATAHAIAITCYIGAAALAAAPVARPVKAPVRAVCIVLALGVGSHLAALAALGGELGYLPLTGFAPALSFAGFVLAVTLLVAELVAREVSLALVAAPLAALPTTIANIIGVRPAADAAGTQGVWLVSHILLSFIGIAAFATAAAAGAMYLLQRRELKARRFGALFRIVPPLATLDRVNHVAALAGWLGLTLGVVLAVSYSIAYRRLDIPQVIWGLAAWVAVSAIALGRVVAGWQARRAAVVSSVGFLIVVAMYVAFRVASGGTGQFL